MCFTDESGPRSHGTQAKTIRPSPSATPAHNFLVSKSVRAGVGEEETLYIRSSMEEEEEEEEEGEEEDCSDHDLAFDYVKIRLWLH